MLSRTRLVPVHSNATVTYAHHNATVYTSSWQLACTVQSLGPRRGVRIIPRDLRVFPIPICTVLMPVLAANPNYTSSPVLKGSAPKGGIKRENPAGRNPLNNFPFYSQGQCFICYQGKNRLSILMRSSHEDFR